MSTKTVRLFALATMLCGTSFAQTFGTVSGLVTDSSNAIVAGATVSVVNAGTNFLRTTTSNSDGNYSFPSLPPGTYEVRVEKDGFQTENSTVELQVQQTARVDFRLNPGSISQQVEVSASAAMLDTENATIGTVIENKRITDLPLNGRSFVSLIALSPNVVTGQTANTGQAATRSGSDRSTTSISIAGLRREWTYYSLDGVSNTDVDYNTYAFLPSIDALQ